MKSTNFECKLTNGINFELKRNLESGPVVLVFILGTWCPPCSKHIRKLEQFLRNSDFDKKGSILVISRQNPEALRKYKADNELSVMMTSDKEGHIARAYGASMPLLQLNLPLTVIINQNGEVERKIGFQDLESIVPTAVPA